MIIYRAFRYMLGIKPSNSADLAERILVALATISALVAYKIYIINDTYLTIKKAVMSYLCLKHIVRLKYSPTITASMCM